MEYFMILASVQQCVTPPRVVNESRIATSAATSVICGGFEVCGCVDVSRCPHPSTDIQILCFLLRLSFNACSLAEF